MLGLANTARSAVQAPYKGALHVYLSLHVAPLTSHPFLTDALIDLSGQLEFPARHPPGLKGCFISSILQDHLLVRRNRPKEPPFMISKVSSTENRHILVHKSDHSIFSFSLDYIFSRGLSNEPIKRPSWTGRNPRQSHRKTPLQTPRLILQAAKQQKAPQKSSSSSIQASLAFSSYVLWSPYQRIRTLVHEN